MAKRGIAPQRSRYSTDVLAGPICKLCGVDWQHVLADSLAALSAENRSGRLVYADEYMHLWNALQARSEIENFSQWIGERMSSGPVVPLLLAMSSAPNFLTGVRRLSQFQHILGPANINITQAGTCFEIDLTSVETGVAFPPTFSAPQIIYMHASCHHLAVRPFKPLSAQVPLPKHERDRLVDLFGCRPEFGHPRLVYKAKDMLEPFVSENPRLWQKTETHLLDQAHRAAQKSPLVEKLEGVLSSLFGHTDPTLLNACEILKVSRSTLIRQLRAEGTTFQTVLDTLRQDRTCHYLRDTTLSNQQIAHLIGYTDTNAFQRAFKKWTGDTPGGARTKLRQRASSAGYEAAI